MFPVSVGSWTWLLVLVGSLSAALNPALEGEWREWKKTHAKEYLEGEESYRRAVWEENLRTIEEHNREASLGKHTYRMGLNQFSDLTDGEFSQRMDCFHPDEDPAEPRENTTVFRGSATWCLPKAVDWRKRGYVTRVKDQGKCGSCWAFSATGALEGLHFKKTKKLVSLSEQNLIDCSKKQGNHGCKGGYPALAFRYVQKNGGLNSEKVYPYEAKEGKCRYKRKAAAAKCTSYIHVKKGSERALQEAVAKFGPISISLHVRTKGFKAYKSGIFSASGHGEDFRHAMLVVGYGTAKQNGKAKGYWILKNSWKKTWGEGGYMRLARGSNQFGLANKAVYPIL